MKTIYYIPFLLFALVGCQFQKPEYLKTISAPELKKLMESEDIFLVDVHTPEQRHIKGTDLYVPYNEIEKYQGKFPEDKRSAIYLYCERGPMGNAAARSLFELGYHDLTNLEGGSDAWRESGLEFQ
ncbi:MAG: rhodanese-like domain-containing protein [Gammaproteobacteria bacterium]